MADPENPPEPPSRLKPEQRKKVEEWFEAKLKGTTAPGCALCGNKNWSIGNDFVAPANFGRQTLQLGGQVYPHFMLMCDVCGNIQFINAIRAGVLDKDGK